MLEQLDAVGDRLEHPADTELAVWFHDAVYDPRRSDNEEQSAALARHWLDQAGAPQEQIERITGIILDTRHKEAANSPDGALVADADLAILAAPEDQFAAYEQAIREEYSHLSDAEFEGGRKQFLGSMLGREQIFQTLAFSRLESLARTNLQIAVSR